MQSITDVLYYSISVGVSGQGRIPYPTPAYALTFFCKTGLGIALNWLIKIYRSIAVMSSCRKGIKAIMENTRRI